MKIEAFQACRTTEGWIPIRMPSATSDDTYTIMVCPWGLPRENICECAGYHYRGECRHQAEAMDRVCGWTAQQIGEYNQTEAQSKSKVCPRCGGPTIYRMEVIDER